MKKKTSEKVEKFKPAPFIFDDSKYDYFEPVDQYGYQTDLEDCLN